MIIQCKITVYNFFTKNKLTYLLNLSDNDLQTVHVGDMVLAIWGNRFCLAREHHVHHFRFGVIPLPTVLDGYSSIDLVL